MTTEAEQNDADGEILVRDSFVEVLIARANDFGGWMAAHYPDFKGNEYDWDEQYESWLSLTEQAG